MGKPFEQGYELIRAIITRRQEEKADEMLFNVFFFARQNGLNQNYDSFEAFKAAMQPQESVDIAPEDILDNVRNILDSFRGGK